MSALAPSPEPSVTTEPPAPSVAPPPTARVTAPTAAPVETSLQHVEARTKVPYKELDYFEDSDEDRARFAGREREIREVAARIAVTRAFVLYGRSGLGKTSLLTAGVFPVLRASGFWPVYVRTLDAPLDELGKALRDPRRCPMDPPAALNETIDDLLERVGGDRVPVLVFDQFEEFFTRFALRTDSFLSKRRARNDFVSRMCGFALDLEREVRVVFSLREDFLHTLDAFQRRLPDLFATAYRMLPLTAAGAREAIVLPLLRDGLPFDERAVTHLVNELAEFDFESARLQVACSELYRENQVRAAQAAAALASPATTAPASLPPTASSQPLNSLRGIFKRYLQGALEKLAPSSQQLARALLDVLFASRGTKYALELRLLVAMGFGHGRDAVGVLRALARQKILRRERRDGRTWFELRHECLVDPIEEWLNENLEFANFRLVRDNIRANARGRRFRQRIPMLLSHDQLERLVTPNRELFRLDRDETEFVLMSAIYDGSSEVCFWGEKFGSAETEELLAELLRECVTLSETTERQMLLGAARAASHSPGRLPATAEVLLEIALHPTLPEEVRRAAGRALGPRLQEAQLSAIRARTRWYKTPKIVRALLADFADTGTLPAGLGWAQRRAAGRLATQRRKDAAIATIREAAGGGVIDGAFGGAIWALTSGAILLWIEMNAVRPVEPAWWLTMVLGSTVLATAFGAIFGYFASQVGAIRQATAGSMPWRLVVRDSKLVTFLSGVAALGALPVLISVDSWVSSVSGRWDSLIEVGLWVGGVVGFWAGGVALGRFILGWVLEWVRSCLSRREPRHYLTWLALTSLVVGVFLPGLLYSTFGQWLAQATQYKAAGLVFGLYLCWYAGLASFLILIMGAACAGVDLTLGEVVPATAAATSPGPRWGWFFGTTLPARRWRLAGLATLIIPWYGLSYGYNSLPLPTSWLRRAPMESDGSILWSPRARVWPHSERLRLVVPSSPRLLHFVDVLPLNLSLFVDGQATRVTERLYLAERPVVLGALARPATPPDRLYLKAEKVLPASDGPIHLELNQTVFAEVTADRVLNPAAPPGQLTGQLSCHLSLPPRRSVYFIRIRLCRNFSEGRRGSVTGTALELQNLPPKVFSLEPDHLRTAAFTGVYQGDWEIMVPRDLDLTLHFEFTPGSDRPADPRPQHLPLIFSLELEDQGPPPNSVPEAEPL